MSRETRKVGSFNSVGIGQIATKQIPLTATYMSLIVRYKGLTLADMTDIKVLLNNQIIRQHSAADLNRINTYNGRTPLTNAVTEQWMFIDFTRPYLRTYAERVFTAIGTGLPRNLDANSPEQFSIEITIRPEAVDRAISLELWAELDLPAPLGLIKYVQRHSWKAQQFGTATAPVYLDFDGYVKGPSIQRVIAWRKVNGVVSNDVKIVSAQLLNDNNISYETTKALADIQANDGFGNLEPSDGLFVIDTAYAGDGNNGFPTTYTAGEKAGLKIEDQRIRFAVTDIDTSTDSHEIVLERIGAPTAAG